MSASFLHIYDFIVSDVVVCLTRVRPGDSYGMLERYA